MFEPHVNAFLRGMKDRLKTQANDDMSEYRIKVRSSGKQLLVKVVKGRWLALDWALQRDHSHEVAVEQPLPSAQRSSHIGLCTATRETRGTKDGVGQANGNATGGTHV